MKKKGSQSTDRATLHSLTEIVNVGKSVAEDLCRVGVRAPQQLIDRDPWKLYVAICVHDRIAHDPCLLDALMSAVDYMNGSPPKKWWLFTAQRKRIYGERLRAVATSKWISPRGSRNKKRRSSKASA
jgi:hypothetical protein